MAIFSERKNRGPVEPEPCVRCRARPGTSWMDFTTSAETTVADANPFGGGTGRAWLCNQCRDDVRREAPGN
jgi:hypothetical protein